MSVPDESDSRNGSCAQNSIFTFLLYVRRIILGKEGKQ